MEAALTKAKGVLDNVQAHVNTTLHNASQNPPKPLTTEEKAESDLARQSVCRNYTHNTMSGG